MRRALRWLLLLLPLAFAAYAIYWHYAAQALRQGLGPWVEARRAEGYDLSWREVELGGFPLSFRFRFSDARLSGTRPTPIAVAAPLLLAEARPWRLNGWQLTAPQGARGEVPGLGDAFAARDLDCTLAVAGTAVVFLDVAAREVTGSGALAGLRIGTVALRASLPEPPATAAAPSLRLTLRIGDLDMPHAVGPLGPRIAALSVEGNVKGAVEGAPLRRALAAWRDAGGTVELSEGKLRWDALAVDATGSLALDGALQPTGALTATIEGQNAIIDAAIASGGLRANDGQLAKTVLGLMAKEGPDGKRRLTLPVRLQNARIFLGPAQIAELPRFTWE